MASPQFTFDSLWESADAPNVFGCTLGKGGLVIRA